MKKTMCFLETLTNETFRTSHSKRLDVSEWKVILELLYGGPASMYSIHKKNNMQYSNVHEAMSKLRKIKWVKIVKRCLSEKKVQSIIYSPTLQGLLWTLSRIPETHTAGWLETQDHVYLERRLSAIEVSETLENKEEKNLSLPSNLKSRDDVFKHLVFFFDIEKVAENYANLLPLIFGRWTIYKRIGAAKSLFWRFPKSAIVALYEYYHNTNGLKDRFGSLDMIFTFQILRELTISYSETPFSLSRSAERLRKESAKQILEAFKGNAQLEALSQQIFKEIITENEESLKSMGLLGKRIEQTMNSQVKNG